MDVQKPTTATTPTGTELTKGTPAQGSIISDGTNDRVLVGFSKDGFGEGIDYGIKVSQEGYDVKSADDDKLVMSSAFNSFKIVATGTLSLSAPSLNTGGANYGSSIPSTSSFNHGLGYTPTILAYWDGGGGEYSLIPRTSLLSNTSNSFCQYAIIASVDDTAVTASMSLFGYNVNTTAFAVNVKYYLMRESAS